MSVCTICALRVALYSTVVYLTSSLLVYTAFSFHYYFPKDFNSLTVLLPLISDSDDTATKQKQKIKID